MVGAGFTTVAGVTVVLAGAVGALATAVKAVFAKVAGLTTVLAAAVSAVVLAPFEDILAVSIRIIVRNRTMESDPIYTICIAAVFVSVPLCTPCNVSTRNEAKLT